MPSRRDANKNLSAKDGGKQSVSQPEIKKGDFQLKKLVSKSIFMTESAVNVYTGKQLTDPIGVFFFVGEL